MWRLLEVGEVIERGDEFWNSKLSIWSKYFASVGEVFAEHDSPARRKVAEPVVPSRPSKPDQYHVSNQTVESVDPGEGYRLLAEGETVQAGDELRTTLGKEWLPAWSSVGKAVSDRISSSGRYIWRRKVTPAVEPVCIGDRVEVLSGAWAGSVGVVVPDIRSKSVAAFLVRLENVCVGGSPLHIRVAVSDVRKFALISAQTVSDPEWRLLEIGEVIRKADEHWFRVDGWSAVSGAVGAVISPNHAKLRRRVRIESPGWRYLDAGETILAGDEQRYSGDWHPCSRSVGVPASESDGQYGFLRRKTVQFAG